MWRKESPVTLALKSYNKTKNICNKFISDKHMKEKTEHKNKQHIKGT